MKSDSRRATINLSLNNSLRLEKFPKNRVEISNPVNNFVNFSTHA